MKCRQTLCGALIQPHIDYCCSSWYGGLSAALKERLNVIQRKMVRFIHGMDYRGHVDNRNLFDLSWMNIPDRVRFFRMSHLFRIRHKLAPKYLLPNFRFVSDAHNYNTRGSSHNFCLTRDLSLSPNSFSFTAIKQWNNLPNDLKAIDTFRVFKKKLKQFLLNQYDWFFWILLDGFLPSFQAYAFYSTRLFYHMLWMFKDPVGKK